MAFFSHLKKKWSDFFAPAPTREELRMAAPPKPLVWNGNGVLLDTHGTNGDHVFRQFTGHILCHETDCEVRNASFTFHAGAMCFLSGQQPSPGLCPGAALRANRLVWEDGELLSGRLACQRWGNGTVAGGKLLCDVFETGTVTGGMVKCGTWRSGTVSGGAIQCGEWLCGTFNSGTFKGEWYGGVWHGGTFNGKVLTGNGTFEWICRNNGKENGI